MRQKKIVVTRYGGPEVITVAEQECPVPMPGEVRVKVLAAGVSLPDILARGRPPGNTARALYARLGPVGVVDQIVESVSGFELGQTVALCRSAAVTHNMFACHNASSFNCPQVWTLPNPSR
jgi:NADPH2:quinone reductase